MKPHLRRLHASMLVLVVLLCLSLAGLRAQSNAAPAVIRTETDGAVSRVEVYGGDVGYPGPSMVELRRDELGLLVVTTTRILPVYDVAVFVPWVGR